MCRVVTLFVLGQSSRSSEHFTYPDYFRKVHRKCFKGIWKKFLLKTWGRNKSQIRGWNLLKKPRVLSWKSFSNASKTLFVDFKNMLGVSERSTWPRFLPQYKKRDHTTHQSDYMSGKVKKVEILKKWSSKWGWNILTKPHFLIWNFFSKVSRKFSGFLTNMFKISARSNWHTSVRQ